MVVAEQRRLPIESDWKPKTAAGANAAVRKCTVLTLVVLAVFALVMLYTYQTTRIISLGYQADNMQSSVTDLQSRNNQLELEVAELQTPGRVEQIATTKLGMQEPQDFMIVSFSPGQVSSQEAQAKTKRRQAHGRVPACGRGCWRQFRDLSAGLRLRPALNEVHRKSPALKTLRWHDPLNAGLTSLSQFKGEADPVECWASPR